MRASILKVLSTMNRSGAKVLLMGGQACVYYGGAEFSIDTDFAVLLESENLKNLVAALNELQAKAIAVPPFKVDFLERGHAVHFRCTAPGCDEMRVDIMAKMRGVAPFDELWERRTTAFDTINDLEFEVMALPDLVAAKKTQRDKDWPMIRALLEAHYFKFHDQASPERVGFWRQELRTPALLREVTRLFPGHTAREATILAAQNADDAQIERALRDEEERERELDRIYWRPLKAELEAVRLGRNR